MGIFEKKFEFLPKDPFRLDVENDILYVYPNAYDNFGDFKINTDKIFREHLYRVNIVIEVDIKGRETILRDRYGERK
jgi:hypothetical protein